MLQSLNRSKFWMQKKQHAAIMSTQHSALQLSSLTLICRRFLPEAIGSIRRWIPRFSRTAKRYLQMTLIFRLQIAKERLLSNRLEPGMSPHL